MTTRQRAAAKKTAAAPPVVFAPQSGRDLLGKVKPRLKVGSTPIILRPDLLDEHDELNKALQQKVGDELAKGRLAGGGRTTDAIKMAQRVQELEDQIVESQIVFTMRAMDTPAWQLLKDRNPPRADNHIDAFVGYNTEAVRSEQVRECLVDPVFDDCLVEGCNHLPHDDDCPDDCDEHGSCGTWQAFLHVCNPSEWDELERLAAEVNGRSGSVPKSQVAERLLAPRLTGPASRKSGE